MSELPLGKPSEGFRMGLYLCSRWNVLLCLFFPLCCLVSKGRTCDTPEVKSSGDMILFILEARMTAAAVVPGREPLAL